MERGQNDHVGPGAQLGDELSADDGQRFTAIPYGKAFQNGVDSVKRLDVEAIARTCYAVNTVYCRLIGDTPRDWDECKDSVISGVNKALEGATPEQLHDAWCQFQIAAGWCHGETKDPVAKTHPCLVSYDDLPFEQRNKDQFFLAVVESLKPLV